METFGFNNGTLSLVVTEYQGVRLEKFAYKATWQFEGGTPQTDTFYLPRYKRYETNKSQILLKIVETVVLTQDEDVQEQNPELGNLILLLDISSCEQFEGYHQALEELQEHMFGIED